MFISTRKFVVVVVSCHMNMNMSELADGLSKTCLFKREIFIETKQVEISEEEEGLCWGNDCWFN